MPNKDCLSSTFCSSKGENGPDNTKNKHSKALHDNFKDPVPGVFFSGLWYLSVKISCISIIEFGCLFNLLFLALFTLDFILLLLFIKET